MQCFVAQEIALGFVLTLRLHKVVSCQEETASATGRVADSLADFWADAVYHRFDKRTWREILAGTALLILSVLLQNPFVYGSLDIHIHSEPVLLINHSDDFFQIYRLLDFVDRFGIYSAYQPLFLTQPLQNLLVVIEKIHSVKFSERIPGASLWNSRFLIKKFDILLIHFQEKKICKLSDIIGETDTLSGKDSGHIPHFFDKRLLGCCVLCHLF